jgi:hypothetical protein
MGKGIVRPAIVALCATTGVIANAKIKRRKTEYNTLRAAVMRFFTRFSPSSGARR